MSLKIVRLAELASYPPGTGLFRLGRLTSCQWFLLENYNLKVNGVELTSADHEVAVEAIQTSSNPIQFVVQSLQHWVSEISLSKQILNDTWLLQPNKERKASEDLPGPETLPPQSDPGTARVPSKLIIPDIFCGQSKTSNKVCVNGMSTSSSNRWLQAFLMRKSFELKLVPQIMLTDPQKLLINIAFHYQVDPYWLNKRAKVWLPGTLLFFGIEKYYKCPNVGYFSFPSQV